MNLQLANNATSALAADITNVATSLTVTAGEGAKFPNPTAPEYYYMTLHQGSTIEVVKVTARATDTFTVVRGQDGTSGVAFTTGAKVELRLNKLQLAEYVTEKMLYEAANGLDKYKNYIFNANAIVDTVGWSTFADLAASTPTDGTGGAPNITWTRNTTTPLNGIADFKLTKDAANRQGEGVSYLCAIDVEDRNKFLGISFNTIVASGTYTNNDLQIFVYDVTNSALLNGGAAILNIEAGSAYIPHFASVYIPSTCASIRFIVYEATTNAAAYTIQFSNFKLTDNPYLSRDVVAIQNVRYSDLAGHGSTNTMIPYYTNLRANTGPQLVTVSNSATLGLSFTANKLCHVILCYNGEPTSNSYRGITLNSTELTTAIDALTDTSKRVAMVYGSLGVDVQVSAAVTMQPGDILRPHDKGYAENSTKSNISLIAIAESENVVSASQSAIERTHYDGYTSRDATGFLKLKTQQSNSASKVYSVDNTNYTKYTFLKKAFFAAGMMVNSNNSAEYSVRLYNSSGTLLNNKGETANASTYASATLVDIANPGDYVVFYSGTSTAPADATTTNFTISAVDFYSQMLSMIPVEQVAYVKDVKSSGTQGGGVTGGVWTLRDLNVINETGSNTTETCSFATISANKLTLQPGEYKIFASVPGNQCNGHQAKMNIESGADVLFGTTVRAVSSDGANNVPSIIIGKVSIRTPTTYEFRTLTVSTKATDGLGIAISLGSEVYTQIEITKLK